MCKSGRAAGGSAANEASGRSSSSLGSPRKSAVETGGIGPEQAQSKEARVSEQQRARNGLRERQTEAKAAASVVRRPSGFAPWRVDPDPAEVTAIPEQPDLLRLR